MNLEFKFNCEQNSTIVEIPPNLLFAYKESVSEKINSIIVYFVLFCCNKCYQDKETVVGTC